MMVMATEEQHEVKRKELRIVSETAGTTSNAPAFYIK